MFLAILIVRTINAIALYHGIFGSGEIEDDEYPPTSSTPI